MWDLLADGTWTRVQTATGIDAHRVLMARAVARSREALSDARSAAPAEVTIRAAGGIVLRDGNDEPEVLVVHRPIYDDWSLPKGKLDPGEDDETAAVREVVEETGVEARITGNADSIEYIDRRGRPKVVRYFMMDVVEDPGHRVPDDEVDIVAWWPIGYARTALTYPRDCDLLAGIGGPR